MARIANRTVLLLLLSLLLLITFSTAFEGYNTLQPAECKPKCAYRCSTSSYKKPCMLFCLKCCLKCLCVPPGTYGNKETSGNKETCPCYNNWKTLQGAPQCP